MHPAAHAKPRRPLQTSTVAELEELYWREFAQRQEAEKLVRRRMVNLAISFCMDCDEVTILGVFRLQKVASKMSLLKSSLNEKTQLQTMSLTLVS